MVKQERECERPAWTRIAGHAVACETCGNQATVLHARRHCCWPCLATALAREVGDLRVEKLRLAALVEAHEGVLRTLDTAMTELKRMRKDAITVDWTIPPVVPAPVAPAWAQSVAETAAVVVDRRPPRR
jgi:hypothetical protein